MKTQTNENEKAQENAKRKSYKCEICGGWIDYTNELCQGFPVVKHRSRRKKIACEKQQDIEYRTKRANEFWERIEERKNAVEVLK